MSAGVLRWVPTVSSRRRYPTHGGCPRLPIRTSVLTNPPNPHKHLLCPPSTPPPLSLLWCKIPFIFIKLFASTIGGHSVWEWLLEFSSPSYCTCSCLPIQSNELPLPSSLPATQVLCLYFHLQLALLVLAVLNTCVCWGFSLCSVASVLVPLVLLQLPVLVLACLFKAGRLYSSVLGFSTCFTCTKGSSQVAAAYSKRAACFVFICTCVFLLAALLCLCLKFVLAGSSLPIQSGQLATLPIKQVAAGRQGQGATITRACSPTTLLLSLCSPTTLSCSAAGSPTSGLVLSVLGKLGPGQLGPG